LHWSGINVQARNIVTGVAIGVAVVCAGGWFHAHQALSEATQSYISETLDPIVQMLEENATLTRELEAPPYAESGVEFVGAYLTKIRRDGVGQALRREAAYR
jgi:hypothetical protein